MTTQRSWPKTVLGLVLTGIMLFPVYWMVNVSFTRDRDMRKTPPDLFPVHGTLDGYRAVLDRQLPFLGTSLLIALGTVALTLAIAAPAGYSLAKLRPIGGAAVRWLLLVAQMIPAIIMAMGFYAIYLSLGVLNTIGGLIVADATIDGAGSVRTFWSVILPVSRNATITVALFAFLWAWSDFIFASTLDGGGRLRPITLGIYHYIGHNNQQWNAIMATAVVASIPATVLLVVAQRYIASGVTAGTVKD